MTARERRGKARLWPALADRHDLSRGRGEFGIPASLRALTLEVDVAAPGRFAHEGVGKLTHFFRGAGHLQGAISDVYIRGICRTNTLTRASRLADELDAALRARDRALYQVAHDVLVFRALGGGGRCR